MSDGHESCDERFQAAKLEALAEFTAGAGHEINNPLAVIINRAQQLLAGETDPERRRSLATIGAQAYRVRDMIGDVMLFARPPKPVPEQLCLGQLVQETADHLPQIAEANELSLEIPANEEVPVWADPVQLKVVVSNLLLNAHEAISGSGRIEVEVTSVFQQERQHASLRVTDDGAGFTELEREHLFDPYYSGRQAGRGLGFGLSKCWRIVTGHGGQIELETAEPGHTTFAVWLPSSSEEAAQG
jgi:signal transduction histidine kinase